MTLTCPHCNERVISSPGDHCPKCFQSIPEAEETGGAGGSGAGMARSRGFRGFIARRSITGVLLGLGLAVIGVVGGEYQHRGGTFISEGHELIWMGLGLAVFFGILYVLTRLRRR